MTEADDEGWRVPKRVTLEDVAKHAEVSRALVSIVMREAPGASSATRERVLAAARELGYRPDVRARALAGQKSRLIGVMFGVEVGIFQFDLLEGLYAAAEQRGHGLIVAPLTKGREERRAAESLHDFRFDALIMLGPPTAKPLLAGRGAHRGRRLACRRSGRRRGANLRRARHGPGRRSPGRLGHSRIAHIDGGENMIGISRRNGYQQAMRAQGLAAYIRRPSIRATMRSTASRAISAGCCTTVVSSTGDNAATWASSQPMTESWPGTSTSCWTSSPIAPTAVSSLYAIRAVGRSPASSSAREAR